MSGDGWVRVVDGVYARGPWRIHRLHRGWSWTHAVQITADYPRGIAPTLADAKQAVANYGEGAA